MLHIAARIIELGAGFFFQRHGFLDAVLHGKAGEQRHIHDDADLGRIGAIAQGDGGRHRAIGIAVDDIARLQVDRGFVTGLGFAGFQFGNIQGQLGLAQLRLAGQRLVDPGLHIVRFHLGQGHGRCQWRGLYAYAAHQLVQCHTFDLQVVLRSNFLCGDQIEAGLGFARIGDGGRADLEIALGHFQLGADGLLLRLGNLHAVLRGQHIEIGLRDTYDQVLCRSVKLGLGHVHAALSLFVSDLVGRTVQRLLGADLYVLLRVVEAAGHAGYGHGGVDVDMGAIGTGRQADTGQQAGQRLVRTAGGGAGVGLLSLPGGVIAARLLNQLGQGLGLNQTGSSSKQDAHGNRGKRVRRDNLQRPGQLVHRCRAKAVSGR